MSREPLAVLVTGGTSLIGREVAARLAARGDHVTVFQRRPSGLPHGEMLGDVTDRQRVEAAVEGVDAVVHLAATANPGRLAWSAITSAWALLLA